MRRLFYRVLFLLNLLILCFLSSIVPLFSEGIDAEQAEAAVWYNLIDAETAYVEDILGDSYTEIEPAAVESSADRIIWYENGITLWFFNDRVIQIRLDSAIRGSALGIKIGSSLQDVKTICGSPWIEADDNLYYNLPWRSAPVRLRMIFKDSGLFEVYLYIVR